MKRRRSSSSKTGTTPKRRRLQSTSTAIVAQRPNLAPSRGPEKKNIDTQQVQQGVPAATYLVNGGASTFDPARLLNGVAQGTDAVNRIGRRITMKSIQIRFHGYSGIGTTLSGRFRVVIVYDKNSNGGTPLASDVFAVDLTDSNLNLANTDRFVVLYDKYTSYICGAPATGVPGYPTITSLKLFRKLNLDAQYSGQNNSVGSISSGAIWMFVGCLGLSSVNPIYNTKIRIRYVDQ